MTAPWRVDPRALVYHGDCLNALRMFPDASVDAVVCDPPYGLSDLSEKRVRAALEAWFSGDRDHVPDGRGFMSAQWDRFVPPPAIWDECLRVLKPGSFLAAFAGSRTVDLMGLSIRMAGFQMGGSLGWVNGSGFPKSLDVSKALDKAAGRTRPVAGISAAPNGKPGGYTGERYSAPRVTLFGVVCDQPERTLPVSAEAVRWSGWGTALKPAVEPVVLARKPGPARHTIPEDAPRFFYTPKAPPKERPSHTDDGGDETRHSTVKPLAVMTWLVELLCPPGGVVLDPFAGSGTTLEAAVAAGLRVIGVEQHAPYLPLIGQRLDRVSRT